MCCQELPRTLLRLQGTVDYLLNSLLPADGDCGAVRQRLTALQRRVDDLARLMSVRRNNVTLAAQFYSLAQVVRTLTSCYSSGSMGPHHCCPGANKVENIDRGQVWVCRSMNPKCAPPVMGSGPLPNTWFLGPSRVRSPNGTSFGSSVSVGFALVTSALGDMYPTPLKQWTQPAFAPAGHDQ